MSDFWTNMAKARDEELAKKDSKNLPVLASAHRKTIKQLMANDPDAGRRAIKAMAEEPELTHRGRNGRRLAAIYGVDYTPWEDRTPAEQYALGQKELRKRQKSGGKRDEALS